MSYDALDRLIGANNGGLQTFYVSDGTDIIAEYDGSNVLQKRYAFDGTGWPLVQYDAAGNRSWMLPDERGSIVALANDSSAMTAINTYDEYGIPGATNQGTFQYAGMMWLSRPGVYAPTFRAYGAHLGRFNQTDPIGMAGGINLYNYTGNNPVNAVDPLGLADIPDIPVNGCTGSHYYLAVHLCWGWGGGGGFAAASSAGPGEGRGGRDDKGQKKQRVPCIPTLRQMKDSGAVTFSGVSASAYLLLGFTVTRGSFATASGITGNFTSIGFGVGVGADLSGVGGGFSNLAGFVGGNDNYQFNGGPVNLSAHYDLNGNLVGASGSAGTGASIVGALNGAVNPILLAATTKASASFSSTDLSNVTCPTR